MEPLEEGSSIAGIRMTQAELTYGGQVRARLENRICHRYGKDAVIREPAAGIE
jgi:hypothetical protein